MQIEQVNIAEIRPCPINAKKHDGTQIGNVAQSIKEFGFVQPLVLTDDNEVIIGHCRLLAAKKLNMQTVPVVYARNLTPEQVTKLRNLDNKLNESEWDMELLSSQIVSLDFSGYELDWGINTDPNPEEVVEDNPPEVDESGEAITKPGDVWILGDHRLICGDSTDPAVVERVMNGQEADLLLTDPPYNVNYKSKAGSIENDNQEDAVFLDFLTDAFTAAKSALKAGGGYYVWHADLEGYNFRQAMKNVGLTVRECLVWVKNAFTLGRQDYQWQHEPCLYGWKDGGSHYFTPDRSQSTVREETLNVDKMKKAELLDLVKKMIEGNTQTTVIRENKHLRNDEHPTMKPVKLFARLIDNSSRPGEIVFDPFGGSGTTVVACEQLNRRARTIELDPHYCDVIVKRWENLTGREARKEKDV